jgi:hypothetical protein
MALSDIFLLFQKVPKPPPRNYTAKELDIIPGESYDNHYKRVRAKARKNLRKNRASFEKAYYSGKDWSWHDYN